MQSLVILPENLKDFNIVKGQFKINNISIHVGITEEKDKTLKDSTDPEESVLVKKIAFSCNFRDKSFILRYYKYIKDQEQNGNLYFSHIGSDFVGEVIDVSKNVKDFKIGDKVIPNISYPSYSKNYTAGVATNFASMRIDSFNPNKLIKIPKELNISDEKLAAFPIVSFTAYSMVRKVVKPKSKILVTAANSNTSIAVITALKNYDVEVFGITTNLSHSGTLKKMGVKKIFKMDHNTTNIMENKAINKYVRKNGKFDVIIDPFFDVYMIKLIDLLSVNAKYITCGLLKQYSPFSTDNEVFSSKMLNQFMAKIMINNISIIGNCIGVIDDGLKALRDLNNGKFDIKIDSVYTSGEESEFLERTFNSKIKFGKVVYKYAD